ncbi:kinase-like protein [Calocera viscosa TUFC12733]|uniref:non-specific serine/threonine protein kinase n=1 Tax=Calocera viscosa (strain TUFC12733) TaxID=1330018 RepID=A0A167JH53_CALVF|nr:kinase-like protein [Calocera viscosa TUFC12733]
MSSILDTLTRLTHPRPQLPSTTSNSNSNTPSRPSQRPSFHHPGTHPHARPDSQSHIPVRPLSQMSNRAVQHSLSQSLSRSQSQSHPHAQKPERRRSIWTLEQKKENVPPATAPSTPGRGLLSKSARATPRKEKEDKERSRPVSMFSLAQMRRSRGVLRPLEPVLDTSGLIVREDLLMLECDPAEPPNRSRPRPLSGIPKLAHHTNDQAVELTKAALHEGRRKQAKEKAQLKDREREKEKDGQRHKSEAERIKDAYRAEALKVLEKVHAPSRPAPPAPATAPAVAAPAAANTTVEPKAKVPLPLPRAENRWTPNSGIPLIRSSLLRAVPDAYRWTEEVWEKNIVLEAELGYGNWGSVWSLRLPRHARAQSSAEITELEEEKGSEPEVYASKLVLFSTEPKTAEIRLWALWKEFQILRGHLPSAHDAPSASPSGEREGEPARTGDRHPGVLDPLAFIEWPKGGLMIMPLLPRQMPVCVREEKARRWFAAVLDAVGWLHARGVVHNDIKPANIMLTEDNQPVLIDFGFAQHHPAGKEERFQSQLAYGTPEYLSPERARSHKHDTRKSDVWALGVTFFEILIGRTPFESTPAPSPSSDANEEDMPRGEPDMTTAEGLQVYWERTVRGEWVEGWEMSRGAEKLLKRMMNPKADGRPFAPACMADPYFHTSIRSMNP